MKKSKFILKKELDKWAEKLIHTRKIKKDYSDFITGKKILIKNIEINLDLKKYDLLEGK